MAHGKVNSPFHFFGGSWPDPRKGRCDLCIYRGRGGRPPAERSRSVVGFGRHRPRTLEICPYFQATASAAALSHSMLWAFGACMYRFPRECIGSHDLLWIWLDFSDTIVVDLSRFHWNERPQHHFSTNFLVFRCRHVCLKCIWYIYIYIYNIS